MAILSNIDLLELPRLIREAEQAKIDRTAELDAAKASLVHIKASVYLGHMSGGGMTQRNAERWTEVDSNVQAAQRVVDSCKKSRAEAAARLSELVSIFRVRYLLASQSPDFVQMPMISEDPLEDAA